MLNGGREGGGHKECWGQGGNILAGIFRGSIMETVTFEQGGGGVSHMDN